MTKLTKKKKPQKQKKKQQNKNWTSGEVMGTKQ